MGDIIAVMKRFPESRRQRRMRRETWVRLGEFRLALALDVLHLEADDVVVVTVDADLKLTREQAEILKKDVRSVLNELDRRVMVVPEGLTVGVDDA